MKRVVLLSVLAVMVCAAHVSAVDSPRFRGPTGDGQFAETSLLKAWPAGGPKQAWSTTGLGPGYSSAVVVGDSVYVTGMDDQNQGILFALGADGAVKQKIPYGPEFVKSGPAPTGARGTAAIVGERAYVVNGFGTVIAIDLAAKKVLWSVDMIQRFNGAQARFGFAECPLVVENMVICTPGGPDASVAALDSKTGETVWTTKGLSEASSYCSPSLIRRGGKGMIVTAVEKSTVGIDPAGGKVLWQFENVTGGGRMAPIQANPPLYADNGILACAGRGTGCMMAELGDSGAMVKWQERKLDCQMQGTVVVDGYVYGTAQSGGAGLICLKWSDGQIMWEAPDVKQAAVVAADGMLYLYGTDGVVRLVKPNPKAFEVTGEFTVTEGTDQHWAHPTIANGRLYIRHGDTLMAYDIKS